MNIIRGYLYRTRDNKAPEIILWHYRRNRRRMILFALEHLRHSKIYDCYDWVRRQVDNKRRDGRAGKYWKTQSLFNKTNEEKMVQTKKIVRKKEFRLDMRNCTERWDNTGNRTQVTRQCRRRQGQTGQHEREQEGRREKTGLFLLSLSCPAMLIIDSVSDTPS